MGSDQRGWGEFGAYSLSGELPRERVLAQIEARIGRLSSLDKTTRPGTSAELADLRAKWTQTAQSIYANLEPWETVFVARHPRRPLVTDYIDRVVDNFCELHGDRVYGDDAALVTGFGYIGERRVMIVGHNRGRSLKERVACNFGCAHPEGYRKALVKMKLAAKFGVPIVSLIDTPGAYPGTGAEERGIARAIAENLVTMPRLPVPIVAVVIGEGGSGGALGIGVSDRMAMLGHSVFSVISPEGCAAILWKTSARAKEAASALNLRAPDLLRLGVIDEILPEPVGGAHRNHGETAESVKQFVMSAIDELSVLPPDQLLARRHERIRSMGSICEGMLQTDGRQTLSRFGSSASKIGRRFGPSRGRSTAGRVRVNRTKARRSPLDS